MGQHAERKIMLDTEHLFDKNDILTLNRTG